MALMERRSRRGINEKSISGTVAATLVFTIGNASSCGTVCMHGFSCTSPSHNVLTPFPYGETAPMPVITTVFKSAGQVIFQNYIKLKTRAYGKVTLLHHNSAVNLKRLPRNISRRLGTQKRHERGHFLGFAQAPQRN